MVRTSPAVEWLGDLTIGQRVARCRKARGMSQEVLAHLLGRSQSWLTKVERGERQLDRMSLIYEVARVLQVDVTEITGQPYGPDVAVQAHAAVPAMRRALTGPEAASLDPTRADGVEPLPALRTRMLVANRLRHDADFDRLGQLLPSLLEDVQQASVVLQREDEHRAALELVVDACHCARAMLKALGYLDLAWIATERGRDAAQRLGDPLLEASSAWNRAEVYLGTGDHSGAVGLAVATIHRLDSELGVLPPPGVSLLGMLHLKAAFGTASMGDERQARIHLGEAGRMAARLGRDRNDFGTLFGPTNVLLHRMGVAMELSLPGEAVLIARSMAGLVMAPERRVRLKVDLARAHAQLRQENEAMRLLMESQRLAPDYLRGHPMARDMVTGLLKHAPRAMATDLRALASRIGVR
jgi:transcriptional regulator with XRE-family HTH domain